MRPSSSCFRAKANFNWQPCPANWSGMGGFRKCGAKWPHLSIMGPLFCRNRLGRFSSGELAMIGLGASMNPTTDVNQAREALISRVDEQLALVNEQIRSADEQLARLSSRKSEAPRGYHSPGRPRGRPWLRGIVGLLIAAYIVAAALVSQSSFGNAVAGISAAAHVSFSASAGNAGAFNATESVFRSVGRHGGGVTAGSDCAE